MRPSGHLCARGGGTSAALRGCRGKTPEGGGYGEEFFRLLDPMRGLPWHGCRDAPLHATIVENLLNTASTFRNVVLINPFPETASGINEATVYPPLGLASLASSLRAGGVHVRIIDANIAGLRNREVLALLDIERCDLAGISMNIITGPRGIELARMIKEKIGTMVCIGGPLVSASPETVMKACHADLAVVGEGESTLLELCEGKEVSQLDGAVWVSADNRAVRNRARGLIDPLDALPLPAYDLLPPPGLYRSRARRKPVGAIITSRGCPFACNSAAAPRSSSHFFLPSPRSSFFTAECAVPTVRSRFWDSSPCWHCIFG